MSEAEKRPEPEKKSRRGDPALLITCGLVSATILTIGLNELQGILRPFFVAIFLCFLVKPITSRLRKRIGLIGYVVAIAVIFGVFSIGNRVISNDLGRFDKNKKQYQKRLTAYREGLTAFLRRNENLVELLVPGAEDGELQVPEDANGPVEPGAENEEKNGEKVDDEPGELEPGDETPGAKDAEAPDEAPQPPPEAVETAVEFILPSDIQKKLLDPNQIGRLLGTSASVFLGFFGEALIILTCLLLILLETDRIPERLSRVYGEKKAERILSVFSDVNASVQRYISLKALVSFITALISLVVMKLFEVHYAVTFGIVVFLLNFVPYIGSVIATVLPCTIGLLQFDSPLTALWLAIALAGGQQVIGNFVEPRMQGKGLSISPVVIILALGFWAWLWGISGMILAVPITVTIRIVLEQFESTRKLALMLGSEG